jgi:hypothetical protein
MSIKTSPASRRAIASRRWWPVSFGLRPRITPLAFARSRPSPVRVRISSRSNSANPPNAVSIKRPCAVVVSAQVSLRDLKPAPFSPMVPSRFRRSRVDRANRSKRVTTNTSPFARSAISLASCLRSERAPLIFSWNIFSHFAAFSSANWATKDWPSVLTRAVCGCRPHEGGAAHTGAGVRKPPKEETAGCMARWRVRRYGDFGAGGV